METQNQFNFEFIDGDISMHVRMTKYTLHKGYTVYRVSHHNTMQEIKYVTYGPETYQEALNLAMDLRAKCYADITSFLQQVM